MVCKNNKKCSLIFGFIVVFSFENSVLAQVNGEVNDQSEPYSLNQDHFNFSPDRPIGSTAAMALALDGPSIWTFDRCGDNWCVGSDIAPIQKFDASGALVNLEQILTNKADITTLNTTLTDVIGSAPETLNTLNELAEAINDNPTYFADMSANLNDKLEVEKLTIKYIKNLEQIWKSDLISKKFMIEEISFWDIIKKSLLDIYKIRIEDYIKLIIYIST